MQRFVLIAIIATLLAICSPTPACYSAVASMPVDYPVPDTPYSIFMYFNGQLLDVTAQAAYNEDHVFLMGSYVGSRMGTNGETIVRDGQIVGYLSPSYQ